MEQAAAEEKARRAAALDASRKRSSTNTPVVEAPDSKRPKLEHDATAAVAPGFDFSALPVSLVTDLIVANLQAFTENALIGLVQAYRHKKAAGPSAPAAAPSIPGLTGTPPPSGPSRANAPEPAAAAPPSAPRMPPSEPRADRDRKTKSATPPVSQPAPVVKQEEPVDPLKMDIDDEEIEYEPERLNMEVWLRLSFRLQP